MYIRKRTRFKLGLLLFLILMGWFFRFPILRAMGNFLVVEDNLSKAERIFVLSGNPGDRGAEAARIYNLGYAEKIVCLGGEISGVLDAYGIEVLTCKITKRALLGHVNDSSAVELLCEGSSTFEEFLAIRDYCNRHKLKKIIVVSSKFHTRRINGVFRGPLKKDGVELVLRGAPESGFEESEWWKNEEGLIFLNNEYVKNFYYWLRY